MPEVLLARMTPTAAARAAVAHVMANGSQFPILDAANLLIAACREADRSDPVWRAFLRTLSQAEANLISEETARVRNDRRVQLRFD